VAGLIVTVLQVWGFGEDRAGRLAERELGLASRVKDHVLAHDLRMSAHKRLRSMLDSREARSVRNGALRDAVIVTAVLAAIWIYVGKLNNSTPTWVSVVYLTMWAAYMLLVPVAWIRFALAFRRVWNEARKSTTDRHS